MNAILETTKYVVENSDFVKINRERIVEFSRGFGHGKANHWLSQAPFDFSHLNEDRELRFVFIFNALSFCYWGDPKWAVEHNKKTYDGAWAMIVALGRAIDEGLPILDFEYCSQVRRDDLKKILRGNVPIPLFEERLNIMHEIGSIILQKYGGNLSLFLKQAGGDALRLLDLIVKVFPSFRDSSMYKGREVLFWKRAQLLVSDLCQMFQKRGFASQNVELLTACADYKLPQIMRRFGILEYARSLAEKIDSKTELSRNSEEEVEIRASTIWAVEYMKEEIQKQNPDITSMEIDDHLWLASQEKFPGDKPYHRIRTVAY